MIQIKEKLKRGEVTKKEVIEFLNMRKRTNPWDKKSLDSIAKWVKNYTPGRKNATRKKKNVAKKKVQTTDTLSWLKDGF